MHGDTILGLNMRSRNRLLVFRSSFCEHDSSGSLLVVPERYGRFTRGRQQVGSKEPHAGRAEGTFLLSGAQIKKALSDCWISYVEGYK